MYYRPVSTRAEDLELMARMDRQYLKTPFYGSRRMKAWLLAEGYLEVWPESHWPGFALRQTDVL